MSSSSRYNITSEPASADTQVERIDITVILDDMFKEFLKLWWLLLIIISILSTVFYFYHKMTYVANYTASSTFTVNANSPYNSSTNTYDQTTANNLAVTMKYLLQSASMERIVSEDMGLRNLPGTINVESMESTNLLTITTTSTDAAAAYNMLQSVLRNYQTVCASVIGSTILTEMDQSGVPSAPSNPENCRKAAQNGMTLGFIVDLALLCLLAVTKQTIRKEEDFEKVLNVECYGAIPAVHFKKRGKNMGQDADTVLIDNYRIPGQFLESVRSVRTRLERDSNREKYKVILVSSAIPGEGKSTVAANLAVGLARKGKSVILVDFDLRSPAVAENMNLDSGQFGTIDVLTGRARIDEALVQYKRLPLGILTGGEGISDTMHILNTSSVEKMINELRELADYVILDTPPSGMLTDASLIARYVDTALFVVRQDYAHIPDIIEGISNLYEENIPICGCVLNYATVGITGYGYGYGYGYGGRYGYGYGRGYGYGKEKKKKS